MKVVGVEGALRMIRIGRPLSISIGDPLQSPALTDLSATISNTQGYSLQSMMVSIPAAVQARTNSFVASKTRSGCSLSGKKLNGSSDEASTTGVSSELEDPTPELLSSATFAPSLGRSRRVAHVQSLPTLPTALGLSHLSGRSAASGQSTPALGPSTTTPTAAPTAKATGTATQSNNLDPTRPFILIDREWRFVERVPWNAVALGVYYALPLLVNVRYAHTHLIPHTLSGTFGCIFRITVGLLTRPMALLGSHLLWFFWRNPLPLRTIGVGRIGIGWPIRSAGQPTHTTYAATAPQQTPPPRKTTAVDLYPSLGRTPVRPRLLLV